MKRAFFSAVYLFATVFICFIISYFLKTWLDVTIYWVSSISIFGMFLASVLNKYPRCKVRLPEKDNDATLLLRAMWLAICELFIIGLHIGFKYKDSKKLGFADIFDLQNLSLITFTAISSVVEFVYTEYKIQPAVIVQRPAAVDEVSVLTDAMNNLGIDLMHVKELQIQKDLHEQKYFRHMSYILGILTVVIGVFVVFPKLPSVFPGAGAMVIPSTSGLVPLLIPEFNRDCVLPDEQAFQGRGWITVNGHDAKYVRNKFVVSPASENSTDKSLFHLKRLYKQALTNYQGDLIIEVPSQCETDIEEQTVLQVGIDIIVLAPREGINFVLNGKSGDEDIGSHMYTYRSNLLSSTEEWLPSLASTSQLAVWKFEITVDKKFTAICCGDLTDTISCTEDESQKTFHYQLLIPTSAGNIGFAVGDFKIHVLPDIPEIISFTLPGLMPLLKYTVSSLDRTYTFFEELLSCRYPYGFYRQVFVDQIPDELTSYAGLSLCSVNVLYHKKIVGLSEYITKMNNVLNSFCDYESKYGKIVISQSSAPHHLGRPGSEAFSYLHFDPLRPETCSPLYANALFCKGHFVMRMLQKRLGIDQFTKDYSNRIVSGFPTRDYLLDCLMASCYIPYYSTGPFGYPLKIDGDYYIDAFYSNNLPILENIPTITISPFNGSAIITPKDVSMFDWKMTVGSQVVTVNMQNVVRGAQALFPPKRRVLNGYYELGFRNAMKFLQDSGLYEGTEGDPV
ncbi:transcription initiation factor TFIID subunit 2 [Ditylenchus destructor]|nr:transcription initiation factor TFIID subunit 2 [Ditylenchus destructor]